MIDTREYQSAETAWRWGARLHDAQHKMERARQEMEEAQREIDWLRAHPPLTYAFQLERIAMTTPTLADEIAAVRDCISFLEANVPGHITAAPGFPKYAHLESALARLEAMRSLEAAASDVLFWWENEGQQCCTLPAGPTGSAAMLELRGALPSPPEPQEGER